MLLNGRFFLNDIWPHFWILSKFYVWNPCRFLWFLWNTTWKSVNLVDFDETCGIMRNPGNNWYIATPPEDRHVESDSNSGLPEGPGIEMKKSMVECPASHIWRPVLINLAGFKIHVGMGQNPGS